MSSKRLPGKALLPLAGKPVLSHVVNRTRAINLVSEVVVATSTEKSDDKIANWCLENSVTLYRGSLNDVLSRYAACARLASADFVVRITADCPMLDPRISSLVVASGLESDSDHAALSGEFPKGLDTQFFSSRAIELAHRNAKSKYDREHVGPFIERNQEAFPPTLVTPFQGLANERWTLDVPEDYLFISEVFRNLYEEDPLFGFEKILGLVNRHPHLVEINGGVPLAGRQRTYRDNNV